MEAQGPPPFWEEKAEQMTGQRVLVGVTYLDESGEVIEQVQFHGVIEAANLQQGIGVRRHDSGEVQWLPPDLRPFHPAEPGEYRLRSTGEVVVDPDFLATWTVTRRPPAEG